MAEANKPKPSMQIEGINETPTTFADVFLVAGDIETGIFNIYFCEKQLSIPGGPEEGSAEIQSSNKAKCVAHLILSQKGFEALLEGLEENRDFTRQLKKQKEEQK